jgi:ParB/RepB/Spo0J family partition protein
LKTGFSEFQLSNSSGTSILSFFSTSSGRYFMSGIPALVAISDIRPNPVALRSVDRESEDYIQLRDSIGDPAIGILNPISVREKRETVEDEVVVFYEIIDGLHRYTAASEVGLEEIPVNIKDAGETEAHLMQVIGNAMKVETKPVQYTKHLQRIISANPTWTMNDLASKVHRSPAWLNQRFGLLKLEPQVQDLVDDGKIIVSNAVILAKLPHDEQLNYIDSAMTMSTPEFGPLVQERVLQIKKAEREGRETGEATFVPIVKPRKKPELEEELNNRTLLGSLVADCESKADAAYRTLEWVLSVDPTSVSVQEAAWNEKRQRVDEEKAKRKAERAQKKAEEAAAAAAKAQEEAEKASS